MGIFGLLLVLAAIPIAAIVWSLLPEGHYPVIVPAGPSYAVLPGRLCLLLSDCRARRGGAFSEVYWYSNRLVECW